MPSTESACIFARQTERYAKLEKMENWESACIFARQTERYAKLEKIGNWNTKLLERVFSHFAKKIMNGKSFAKLLKMLLINQTQKIYIVNYKQTIYNQLFFNLYLDLMKHLEFFFILVRTKQGPGSDLRMETRTAMAHKCLHRLLFASFITEFVFALVEGTRPRASS